ncbi:MAG: tetratricopeptide repeat protein [Chthoniobacterales bacterium]
MKTNSCAIATRLLICSALCGFAINADAVRPSATKNLPSPAPAKALPAKRGAGIDDSFRAAPAADLALNNYSLRKADALALFVEGARLEESGEVDAALVTYQKVLTVDPGEIELASRVASLLTRQEDFPRAIDVLKDAIKANPKELKPYLQLAFIYAKHLQKPEQAIKYANQAIALDPEDLDAYQRIYEIEAGRGDGKKALAVLERAAKVESHDPNFWTRLGKLYATILFPSDAEPAPEDLRRVNALFRRAADNAGDDAAALKDIADYFAASQQVQDAIPLYLRALELEPDDLNAREKLATGFAVTNQRGKAIEMLEEIIKQSPDKYQPYELLAQLADDEGRALQRAKQTEQAKSFFAKAAANYEQCLLINPTRGQTYLRLAELLMGALHDSARAERILAEGRARFSQSPEFAYYLAIAQREAKHPQQSIITFEEALQEAEASGSEMVTARFFFDYGAAAEQAGLYDKSAELFRRSIALDPANAAEAYNYVGYMWVEHNMHLEEAEEMIKKALELDPNNGAYLDSLGWLNYRKGKYEEALANLQRAIASINRDDPVVFEHLGDVYAKLNRIPQALDYWQKAVALAPENKALADKIESTKTKMSKGEPNKAPPF